MAKRKQTEYIQGRASHRRTEADYMVVLLDAVTLDDWRGVVTGALQAAKGPEMKAPTPLNIVVQQLNGCDPLVEMLAKPTIERDKYPYLHTNDAYEAQIRALVATELVDKMQQVETVENPKPMRVSRDLSIK
jgi:hypothetical protein